MGHGKMDIYFISGDGVVSEGQILGSQNLS